MRRLVNKLVSRSLSVAGNGSSNNFTVSTSTSIRLWTKLDSLHSQTKTVLGEGETAKFEIQMYEGEAFSALFPGMEYKRNLV